MNKDFSSILLKILGGVRRIPHSTIWAHAPAVMAAATEVPVAVVKPFLREGPETLTPGDAKSGLICPVRVKPRLEFKNRLLS